MTDHPVRSELEELRQLFGHVKGEGPKMPSEITPEDVRRNEVALQILSERSQQKALDSFHRKIQRGVLSGTIDAAHEEYLLGIYAEAIQVNCRSAAKFWAKHDAPQPTPQSPLVAFAPSLIPPSWTAPKVQPFRPQSLADFVILTIEKAAQKIADAFKPTFG